MILYNVWVIFPTRSISWEYWSHVVSHNSWCIFLVKEQDQVGNLWSIRLIHASSMHGDPPHGPSTRSQRSWSKCKTFEIITVIFTKSHLFCAKKWYTWYILDYSVAVVANPPLWRKCLSEMSSINVRLKNCVSATAAVNIWSPTGSQG